MSQDTDYQLTPEEFEIALRAKEEVIAALTDRLHETAEQLDRLQRSGVRANGQNDASGRPSFSLSSQVEAALQAFDELAPMEHFERIESGISQILELLSSGAIAVQSGETEEQLSEKDNASYWESTKAKLLGEAAVDLEEETRRVLTEDSGGDPAGSHPLTTDDDNEESLTKSAGVPLPVDPPRPIESLTDLVELEEGISERDSYISYLVARLRVAESRHDPPKDWEGLASAPEELKESLINMQNRLEDHLRQSEVAVSLERAGLTRERSKLFKVKQHLEQEVKRMGLASTMLAQEKKNEDTSQTRWGKFFEVKKST